MAVVVAEWAGAAVEEAVGAAEVVACEAAGVEVAGEEEEVVVADMAEADGEDRTTDLCARLT